jgi:hypothetical protein
MTATKEAWDRLDMGVTCPHRCDRVLLQPSVSTEKLAPWDQPAGARNLTSMPRCHTKAVDCVQGGMGQTRSGCDLSPLPRTHGSGMEQTRSGCDLAPQVWQSAGTALSRHTKAGTMRSARWRKKPYFNATVSHLVCWLRPRRHGTDQIWVWPVPTGVTECCYSPELAQKSWHSEISLMAQETLLQCHCGTLRPLTASKEAWDRPDMGVTCPHRCDRVLVQPSVGTQKLAPWDQPAGARNLTSMPLWHTKAVDCVQGGMGQARYGCDLSPIRSYDKRGVYRCGWVHTTQDVEDNDFEARMTMTNAVDCDQAGARNLTLMPLCHT